MKTSALPPDSSSVISESVISDSVISESVTSQPVRLLAGGGNELDRRLLQSARLDLVPAAAALRVAQSLGMPSLATGLSSSVEALPKASVNPSAVSPSSPNVGPVHGSTPQLARWASWGGLGLFGVVGALVASQLVRPSHVAATAPASATVVASAPPSAPSSEPSPAPALTLREPETARDVARAATSRAPLAPEPDELPTARAVSRPRATVPASTRSVRGPVLLRPAAPPARDLLAEVHQLEAVQKALKAGETEDAARALDAYRTRFPAGELGLEAELLNVDVTLAQGQHARARTLARALARRPDAARYRARLDALLAATAAGD